MRLCIWPLGELPPGVLQGSNILVGVGTGGKWRSHLSSISMYCRSTAAEKPSSPAARLATIVPTRSSSALPTMADLHGGRGALMREVAAGAAAVGRDGGRMVWEAKEHVHALR